MAGKRQLINGKAYDWSSIDINVPGCENIEVTEISYSDTLEREIIYGKGGKGRGYGNGNLSTTCDLTMQREDYNELCRVYAAKGKKFYGIELDKITVSYADEGAETSVDTITRVIFNGRDFKAAQGDKGNTVTIKGTVAGSITSNGMGAL